MADDLATTARRRRHGRKEDSATVDHGNNNEEDFLKRKRRRRRKAQGDDDLPFYLLVLQVGATIFIVCAFVATLWKWVHPAQDQVYDDDDEFVNNIQEAPTEPSLPKWTLNDASPLDAFGIAETLESDGPFWKVAATIRQDFCKRFGGEIASRAILQRGLSTFANHDDDTKHTACRIQNAKRHNRPFLFAFGGYSVTVGRGNYFSQSFPLVMERILQRPFSILGIELKVRNAAIGGIPSFPYGFCMNNFWGMDADVVSWDYSMNEAGGKPEGLEAYIRHAMGLDRAPKLIVKDTHMAEARRNILKQCVHVSSILKFSLRVLFRLILSYLYRYAEMGFMVDSVVIHTDPAATPFLALPEDQRPHGFKEWRKFGSPPGAPGQALHHPAVKEHEFIAWLLVMHFLNALQFVAADEESKNGILQCDLSRIQGNATLLPPPVSVHRTNTTREWFSLMYGEGVGGNSTRDEEWRLNPVHCRTSFEPILQGNLDSLIVSGTYGDGTDIMQPKGAMYYSKGWVLDLSDEEKLAKRKLDRFNGLGYVDSKKAYYGIYASGPLRMFLPYQGPLKPKAGDEATDWFKSVVFCEVNEKRIYGSCKADKHIAYTIGGVNATLVEMIDSPGTLYYGKKLCLYAQVPTKAKLTSKGTLLGENGTNATTIGLVVDVIVKDMHIMKKELACSLSHVIWEQTMPTAT
jgi:hypothetical protein